MNLLSHDYIIHTHVCIFGIIIDPSFFFTKVCFMEYLYLINITTPFFFFSKKNAIEIKEKKSYNSTKDNYNAYQFMSNLEERLHPSDMVKLDSRTISFVCLSFFLIKVVIRTSTLYSCKTVF